MAEYVAGRGTTALGIIGTVLGSIGTAGGLSLLGAPAQAALAYENTGACMHDVQTMQEMAEKDSQIARLESEKYTNNAVIDLYKYVDGELKNLRADSNNKWTDQAVINANLSNGLTAVNGQVQSIAQTVANITRTAVPSSAICNFGGCSTCGTSNI